MVGRAKQYAIIRSHCRRSGCPKRRLGSLAPLEYVTYYHIDSGEIFTNKSNRRRHNQLLSGRLRRPLSSFGGTSLPLQTLRPRYNPHAFIDRYKSRTPPGHAGSYSRAIRSRWPLQAHGKLRDAHLQSLQYILQINGQFCQNSHAQAGNRMRKFQ